MTGLIPGTRDDITEGVDLEAEHPFFGSCVEADRFVYDAILPNIGHWHGELRMVDFGGGQGLLAERCSRALRARALDVRSQIVDANPRFIARARARGLEAVEADIADYDGELADLALMRLVLHYNPASTQPVILSNVYRDLADGGLFVMQFESGDASACELRNRVAALSAEWIGGDARFWADLRTIFGWLQRAGFSHVYTLSDAVHELDVVALVRNAWRRQSCALANAGVEEQVFYQYCADAISAFRRSNGLNTLHEKGGRLTLDTSYPIICATKGSIPRHFPLLATDRVCRQ